MIGIGGFGVPAFGPKEMDMIIEIELDALRAIHKTLIGSEWTSLSRLLGIIEIVQECSDYIITPKNGESYQKFFLVGTIFNKIIVSKFYKNMSDVEKRKVLEGLDFSADGNVFIQQKLLASLTEVAMRIARSMEGNRPKFLKEELDALKDPSKEPSKKTKTKKAIV